LLGGVDAWLELPAAAALVASASTAADLDEDARVGEGSSAAAKFSLTIVVTWEPAAVSTRVLDASIAFAAAALYFGCFLLDFPLLEVLLLKLIPMVVWQRWENGRLAEIKNQRCDSYKLGIILPLDITSEKKTPPFLSFASTFVRYTNPSLYIPTLYFCFRRYVQYAPQPPGH
jgi:hypothetical protein